jgi:hypothetical protein
MQGDHATGAGGVDRQGRTLEIVKPAHTAGDDRIGGALRLVLERGLWIHIQQGDVVDIEPGGIHRGPTSGNIFNGDTCVFQRMIGIFHNQSLLGIERVQLALGHLEEGRIEVDGVLFEEIRPFDMELHIISSQSVILPFVT